MGALFVVDTANRRLRREQRRHLLKLIKTALRRFYRRAESEPVPESLRAVIEGRSEKTAGRAAPGLPDNERRLSS